MVAIQGGTGSPVSLKPTSSQALQKRTLPTFIQAVSLEDERRLLLPMWSIITYGCYAYESTYFWVFMCCITCDASGRVNKSNVNANVKGSISAADRKRNHQGFFYSSIINEGWRLIYRLITRLHRERDTMMEGVNKKERVERLVSYRNPQADFLFTEKRGATSTQQVSNQQPSFWFQGDSRSFSQKQATNIHDLTNW